MQVNSSFTRAALRYSAVNFNQHIYLFTGTMPTQEEIEAFAKTTTSHYKGVIDWAEANVGPIVAQIQYANLPTFEADVEDEFTFFLSEEFETATIDLPDTAPTWFMYVIIHGTTEKTLVIGSVGDENSEADMKIKGGSLSADQTFKFNDIILNIARL